MKHFHPTKATITHVLLCAACSVGLLFAGGCDGDDGDDGKDGAQGPPGDSELDDELDPEDDAPGVNIEILSVTGGSGGNFQVGDDVTLTYTVKWDDGTDWDLAEFNFGRAMVSGPTSNYQRVLAEVADVAAGSTTNSDGSHSYTFATPIPAVYLPPLNDTPSFGLDDGELQGLPLLPGTYTVGLYYAWNYSVEDDTHRDVGNATFDFLFGGASILEPRQVVKVENCNQCHVELQLHGGLRRAPELCVLCHTAGAEDKNNPAVAGGTPGVSITFKVMVHKIHNGEHLPSVLGIGVNPDGSRDYTVPPEPYQVVGFGDNIHDFSEVGFPVWPSLSFPMPRDAGYSALGSTEQGMENTQRSGPVACFVCHGDPDGPGPLTAPLQGDLVYTQPSKMACGSCHDDVDWDLPYTSNMQTMPPNDDACVLCHVNAGGSLDVFEAHGHPLLDPAFNPGLVFDLMSVEEGVPDDGVVDPGDKVAVTFTLRDDMGLEVDPADLSGVNFAMSGPTWSYNLLAQSSIPTDALVGPQPYTLNLPMNVYLEYVGDSTGSNGDVFTTEHAPHWAAFGRDTTVFVRTATGAVALLMEDAVAPQNYLDVDDGSLFARNDFIVVDDGSGLEEYLLVQWVEDDRLWFSSAYQTGAEPGAPAAYKPGIRFNHDQGSLVEHAVLFEAVGGGVNYTLDPIAGTITEDIDFGAGRAVVVSYTTDFVMPFDYPLGLNDSPDLGEERGQWAGKSLVDGTYTVGLWGYRSLSLDLFGESNSYRAAASAVNLDFLVGSATDIEPYGLISSANNCYACHQDLYFHGGSRRGFGACIMCHGSSGAEDRPQYRAPNAPDTEGVEIRFREMLHKIHMGADLANASSYTVTGFGSGSQYPNNFSEHHYEEVEFPPFAGGVKHCTKCHGEGNTAWMLPKPANHPTEQGDPSRPWTAACGACHDGDAAQAHIEAQTAPSGAESCTVCHEGSGELSIELVHKTR